MDVRSLMVEQPPLKRLMRVQLPSNLSNYGAVAQLGERYLGRVEAEGSNPSSSTKEAKMDIRRIALDLLKDCFEDEIAHLELRIIRDDQAPRFKKLRATHSEFIRTS